MRIVVRVLLALLAAFSSSPGSATLLRPPVARRSSWSCRFIGVVLREQGDTRRHLLTGGIQSTRRTALGTALMWHPNGIDGRGLWGGTRTTFRRPRWPADRGRCGHDTESISGGGSWRYLCRYTGGAIA